MAALSIDRKEILRTWNIFRQPGEVLEVRVPKAKQYKTISGYFDNSAMMADAVVGLADGPFAGIYFTINPVNPDLLARAANRCLKYTKSATTDKDIVALRWLPIDLDATRPAGISSTDQEHEAALSKAKEIRRWLIEEQGWPAGAFILADSGNGSHLVIRIDLPNEPGNVSIVKSCQEALDFKFSDDVVHVDTTTYNPARIWKIYGTTARKGDNTPERPHRLAKLLEVPEPGETAILVTREKMETLANLAPTRNQAHIHGEDAHTCRPGFDVVKYVEAHGAKVKRTSQNGEWSVYELEECPFDHSHNRGEAFISIHSDGARAFKCHHNSCRDRDWSALRNMWEPDLHCSGNGNGLTNEAALEGLQDRLRDDSGEILKPEILDALAELKIFEPIRFGLLFDDLPLKRNAKTAVNAEIERIVSEKIKDSGKSLPPEVPDNVKRAAREIIERGKAYEYIYGVWQKRVKGNQFLGKSLLISRGAQSCENTEGIHVYAHGKHGQGKSHGMSEMAKLVPPEYLMDEDVSPLAIYYASKNGILLTGTTLLIDEMVWNDSLGGIIKRVITKFQTGAGHLTVIDGESILIRTQPRLAIWTNSADLQADEQLRDRFLDVPIKEGPECVKDIIEFQKSRDTLPDAPEDVERENAICQEILRDLAGKMFIVKIPFSERIQIQSSEGPRGYNIFSDLVKGLTATRYAIRETNEKGELLANEDDFNAAKAVYEGLKGHSAERYGTAEVKVLQAIIDHGYKALIKDIKDLTGMSEGRIKDIVNGRGKDEQKRHGLRYKCSQLDVNTVDLSVPLSAGDYGSRVTTHPVEYSLPRDFRLNNGLAVLIYLDPDVERRIPDVDHDVEAIDRKRERDVVDVVKEEREERDILGKERSNSIPSFSQKGENPTSTTSGLKPIAKDSTSGCASPCVGYVDPEDVPALKAECSTVYVLKDILAFEGLDGVTYGPFKAGDVADVPSIHIKGLISKRACRLVGGSCDSIEANLRRAEDVLVCRRIKNAIAYGITDPIKLSEVVGIPVCIVAKWPGVNAITAEVVLGQIAEHRRDLHFREQADRQAARAGDHPKDCGSCLVALKGDKTAIKCDPCVYIERGSA